MGDFRNNHEQPHDSSAQHNVIYEENGAFDSVQEFHTAHSHDGADAENEGEYDSQELKDTSLEPHAISHSIPQDHILQYQKEDGHLHNRKEADPIGKSVEDRSYTEHGRTSFGLGDEPILEDLESRHGPTFYQRYRVSFHLIIWLFFTGFV